MASLDGEGLKEMGGLELKDTIRITARCPSCGVVTVKELDYKIEQIDNVWVKVYICHVFSIS